MHCSAEDEDVNISITDAVLYGGKKSEPQPTTTAAPTTIAPTPMAIFVAMFLNDQFPSASIRFTGSLRQYANRFSPCVVSPAPR